MANLSGSIDFSAVFDKSGPTPIIRLIDPNHYPVGVAPTLSGVFKVTQPDGLQVTSTAVTWNGSALTQPTVELRLNTANTFQNGGYSVLYTVTAPGYDVTTLTKTINLTYVPPVVTLTKGFDIFTPILTVTDATNYEQGSVIFSSVTQTWQSVINSVLGTSQTTNGSGVTFDLAYLGSYYDSQYIVNLITNPEYTIDWVTLIDELIKNDIYYAEIPPTLFELLTQLTELKSEVDATGSVCGGKCDQALLSTYELAVSIYSHLIYRGKTDEVSGLNLYVYQLQKIFNNCKTPTYVNTNEVIPAYDWGGNSGTIDWDDITGKPSTVNISWVVGNPSYPGNGATTLTDARLANKSTDQLIVLRNNIYQFSFNPLDGSAYYTKASTAVPSIVFSQALTTGETVTVIILPL